MGAQFWHSLLCIYCLYVCFLKLFVASCISCTFLGFHHLAEGLWRCLKCQIATPPPPTSPPVHINPQLDTQAPDSYHWPLGPWRLWGGCTLIWSTVSSILKAHFSGGRDLCSPSISFALSAALSCYYVVGSIVLNVCAAPEDHLLSQPWAPVLSTL